jgi:hypothetical protein
MLSSEHVLYSFSRKVSVQGYKMKFFLPVHKLPIQIGFTGVRNSEPKFSCLSPFKPAAPGYKWNVCTYLWFLSNQRHRKLKSELLLFNVATRRGKGCNSPFLKRASNYSLLLWRWMSEKTAQHCNLGTLKIHVQRITNPILML